MYLSYTKAIQQKNFQTSGGHQGHLEGGKLNAGRNQVNTFQMMEDALASLNWLVVEDAAQSGGYSKRQLVRSGIPQTDDQAALCVCVKKQTSFLRFSRATPRLIQVVVLPTLPFWLTMAMI